MCLKKFNGFHRFSYKKSPPNLDPEKRQRERERNGSFFWLIFTQVRNAVNAVKFCKKFDDYVECNKKQIQRISPPFKKINAKPRPGKGHEGETGQFYWVIFCKKCGECGELL